MFPTHRDNLELEKYDGYWQEGVPSLDSVEFKFIADVDTAFVELQAGTIDILKYLTAAQAETLGDDYNIVQGSMNLVHAMYLNSLRAAFQDRGASGTLLCGRPRCDQQLYFRRKEPHHRLPYDSGNVEIL